MAFFLNQKIKTEFFEKICSYLKKARIEEIKIEIEGHIEPEIVKKIFVLAQKTHKIVFILQNFD